MEQMGLRWSFSFAVLCIAMAPPVRAASPNDALICQEQPETLDKFRYLRALSLDLRGHLPAMDEIEGVANLNPDQSVPEALIDAWLNDGAFVQQVIRHHRNFFWNNITNVDLITNRQTLRRSGGVHWSDDRSREYRTGSRLEVRCADRPAEFDDEGQIVTEMDADGFQIEGWVDVAPYWAPDETIRVCAFDAQTAPTAAVVRA